MDTEVSKNQGEQVNESPMATLADEKPFSEHIAVLTERNNEALQKDCAMVGEISKVEDKNTRELLIACLPAFYRNRNPRFQAPVEHRHEVLDAMLKYPEVKSRELVSFTQYMQNISKNFAENGDGKRAHMYYELAGGKDDKYGFAHGYFAQMEVGNNINKSMREHNGRDAYCINDYKCYEVYKDKLKQGEEIIREFQTTK